MKKTIIKKFEELGLEEFYQMVKARIDVFVVEQQCAYGELDNIDQKAIHVAIEENDELKAYLRVFRREGNVIQIGRVLSLERHKNYGFEVMKQGIKVAKEEFKGNQIYIEAQTYTIGFYEKFGFKVTSEPFLEDGISHVQMILNI